jgi:mono/diheme cytochrome c family protein
VPKTRLRLLPLTLAVVVLAIAAAPWSVPWWARQRSDNAILRGQRLADANGCWACHRAPNHQELANPGSAFGTVPALAGSNLMMYVDHPEETAEWIRNGYSDRLRADPDGWARYRSQLIQMPGFGGLLNEREIADLVAFVLAVDGYHTPADPAAARGAELARLHCLACHNVGGAGGLANPGSAFGYIPALWGPDFHDLVESDQELAEWIRTGSSVRVASLPLATWFLGRQQIQMPAFGDVLTEEQVADLIAYVHWLGDSAGGTAPADHRR